LSFLSVGEQPFDSKAYLISPNTLIEMSSYISKL